MNLEKPTAVNKYSYWINHDFYLEVELPGFTKEQIKVEIDVDGIITISANYTKKVGKDNFVGKLSTTTFKLPYGLSDTPSKCFLEHGVLYMSWETKSQVKKIITVN